MDHFASSGRLARQLSSGEHRLYNDDLRKAYGVRRVTPKARRDIARQLEELRIEVLSNPADEPLVVRKLDDDGRGLRFVGWPSRSAARWARWVALVCLFLLLVSVARGREA